MHDTTLTAEGGELGVVMPVKLLQCLMTLLSGSIFGLELCYRPIFSRMIW